MIAVFRVDASIEIGSGHLMRCLTLADELKRAGGIIYFICRLHNGNMVSYIRENKGYIVFTLPVSSNFKTDLNTQIHSSWLGGDWDEDAALSTKLIKQLSDQPDWLIIDHYALDERWEKALRPLAKRTMVIDDLADRKHDCDVLLDQNLYENMQMRYDGLVPGHTRTFLGPEFALLRPEYNEAKKRLRIRDGSIKNILLFFGGSDPENMTLKTLSAIQILNRPEIAVNVVVGASNPNKQDVKEYCESLENVAYYEQVDNMAELMAEADLAIGAGGSTTWERCFLGLPSLVFAIAKNQFETSQMLAMKGVIKFLGDAPESKAELIADEVRKLLNNVPTMRKMEVLSKKLIPLIRIARLAEELVNYDRCKIYQGLRLRNATISDTDLFFQWVNDSTVRANSLNSEIIPFDTHKNWFAKKVTNPQSRIYIFENETQPVGQIRFDLSETMAEVDISIDSKYRGNGLSAFLIQEGVSKLVGDGVECTGIVGVVKEANCGSAKAFEKAGFEMTEQITLKNTMCRRYYLRL